MADLRAKTLTGRDTTLREATVTEFKKSLRGELILPNEPSYDESRKLWNAMIDRRPGLIARCAGVSDVINAVNFARTNNLLVSVRGGGHNIPGNCVCDGGLMIDLSRMNAVRVDPVRRTARAQGGTKWGDFDHETQAFGLATTGGTDADTGIAGLTMGGGIGWLAGKHGLACDNLLSADVVTADGRFVRASSSENSDLLWGLRGGGGWNFGIVTSFQYQLHPVGPTVLAGLAFYPFQKAKEFLRFYGDFSSRIPDEMNTIAGLGTSPDGSKVGVMAVCYHGSLAEGERILRPIREFGPPLADHIQPMPYTVAQKMLAPIAPPGRHYYIKSTFMQDIRDGAIGTMVDHFMEVTSPFSAMIFQQMGNAAKRADAGVAAFSHRDAEYEWAAFAGWLDPGESEIHIRWARDFSEAMQPFTLRRDYVNQIGTEAEEGADRIRSAYGASYQRLVALKNKYDPTNLFRHNQNIKPTA